MHTDLREEIWHCLRFWLFDYRYFGPTPFQLTESYGFSPAAFHALSHWKQWMARKPEFQGIDLEVRYNSIVRNDSYRKVKRVVMHIPPDGGEIETHDHLGSKQRHDYVLRTASRSQVVCIAEVEYGLKVEHMTEDLPKLLTMSSPLKVMVYRMNYPDRVHPEDGFAQRKVAVEAMIAAHPSYAHGCKPQPEDWLFVGYPYYRKPYPKQKDETFLQMHTLDESLSLVKLDWDIWQPDPDMDRWFRSLYPPVGGAMGVPRAVYQRVAHTP